jgi:hypothetical protein
MKYMRITAGYTWPDHKANREIGKELNITPVLDKVQDYKINWIQYVNRMPRNRLPNYPDWLKNYTRKGRRNYERQLNRRLDAWDQNGSTSGPLLDCNMMMMKQASLLHICAHVDDRTPPNSVTTYIIRQSCCKNVILFDKNVLLIFSFNPFEAKPSNCAPSPLSATEVTFLRTDYNGCKGGRSISVVLNSLNVLRITHLSDSSISVSIFLLGIL